METKEESNNDDMVRMNAAYEIGKYIHKLFVVDTFEESEAQKKPWATYKDHFSGGPNAFYHQLETGLALGEKYGMPHTIYTPWGKWPIVGSYGGSGDSGCMLSVPINFETCKETLGLKLLSSWKCELTGDHGNIWTITKWGTLTFADKAVYRGLRTKYITYETIRDDLWPTFWKSKN